MKEKRKVGFTKIELFVLLSIIALSLIMVFSVLSPHRCPEFKPVTLDVNGLPHDAK